MRDPPCPSPSRSSPSRPSLSLRYLMLFGSGHLFGIVRTFINPLLEIDCITDLQMESTVLCTWKVASHCLHWIGVYACFSVSGCCFLVCTILGPCQNPAKCLSVYRKARKTGLKSAFDECLLTTIKSPSS